ncbi:MAG: elongation factor P [Anaerolineae bacterium]|nr:MAG: elongation factor P [Anaerolineae bacterium]
MIDANQLRKGTIFKVDDQLLRVVDYSHNKTGRGLATIRVKAVNLRTGSTTEKTFSSSERVENAQLEFHNAQYLYTDGEFFHFMDTETFEQPALTSAIVGDYALYLKEQMEVKITVYEGETLDLELPLTVELEVTTAEASARGNTATGVNKKVVTDTGLEVLVPAFVNVGDVIRVDTRTGEYLTRV